MEGGGTVLISAHPKTTWLPTDLLGILKVANSSLRALAADVPAQAIADGPRQAQTLRERALRLFGFKREPGA